MWPWNLLAQRNISRSCKLMPEDVFPDPYGIVESAWVDDVTKNGQIYNSAIYIYRR